MFNESFSYWLFRHNKFHNKKNLINIMNSITNEKLNQLKQKLFKETNNIIIWFQKIKLSEFAN